VAAEWISTQWYNERRGGTGMLISVVIPARNSAATLGDCLGAIGSSSHSEAEVIVVDDCSIDNTAAIAEAHGCRVVRSPTILGAAGARNLGARLASGPVVLFTDSDILFRQDTLQLLAEDLSDPAVAGVVGLLGPRIRHANFASQFKNLWMFYTYSRLAETRAAREGVGLFFTSIAAIRKPLFEQMGGFDTNYEGASVTEDIDFGQRLYTAGHKVLLDGRLQVEHLKPYTLSGVLKTDLERSAGLTKTWLRKRLERKGRRAGDRYYASVPLSFGLSVPAAWLLPAMVGASLLATSKTSIAAAVLTYASLLLLNAGFLRVLIRERGLAFGIQSCLFLPPDLWVSGLGAAWGIVDYLRGNRY